MVGLGKAHPLSGDRQGSRARWLRGLLAVALAAGCVWAGAVRAEVIRLEERLSEARIRSPLRGVKTVQSLDELPGVKVRSVLALDFEHFDPKAVGWSGPPGCRVREGPAGPGGLPESGKALHFEGQEPFRCVFVVPAQPAAHYRISRSIRSDQPLVDFAVLESRLALDHPETLNHAGDLARTLNASGRFLVRHAQIYTHQFPPIAQTGTWSRESIHLFTSPHTQSLVLMLQDSEGVAGPRSRDLWIDDLAVDRLEPNRRQELALLKSYELAEGSDPALGIAKHGQLLPVSGEVIEPPHDVNFEYRFALFAPAPTTLAFDLDVPRDARLDFSYAMFKASRPGDAAQFRVVAAQRGGDHELFRRKVVVRAGGAGWYWREAEIDLARYAGKRIRLRLETLAPPGTRGYALWGSPIVHTPRSAEEPPSVVLIAVDTLRADRLSAYGYARKTSPNLDALAADGVLFRRAISSANWTAPSFASILTGLLPSQHHVTSRGRAVGSELQTVAEYFRRAGWLTRGVAYKPFLYNMGFEQGFDTWFNAPAAESTADAVLSKALAWLDRYRDRQFFLFVHFDDPHQPFNQPAPFDALAGEALDELGVTLPIMVNTSGQLADCPGCSGPSGATPLFKAAASDLYDGEIGYVDDRIGRLLARLKQIGRYDDSVIVFVSDHGEMLFERGDDFGHGGRQLFDELVRVPLIVKPPAGEQWARGRIVDTQVRSFDLMPTLLELVGIDAPTAGLEARTLAAALRAAPAQLAERVGVSENVRMGSLAVSAEGFKYVLDHPPGEPAVESLYRLASDPAERTDVIEQNPEVLGRLRAAAIGHLLRHRAGYYVLVTGDGQTRDYRIEVETHGAAPSVQPIIGPRLVDERDGVFRFEGQARGQVVLFARFDGGPAAGFDVSVETEGLPALAVKGSPAQILDGGRAADTLQRLLSGGGARVHVLHTESPILAREVIKFDARRREALEALGYVE